MIVGALSHLQGAKNRQLFILRAAEISKREVAFFVRRRAELLAQYHHNVEPLVDFITAHGFPLNVTRSGQIVAIFPLDRVAWTKPVSDLVTVIDEDLRGHNLGNNIEVRITGTATASAREGLSQAGWKLVENTK